MRLPPLSIGARWTLRFTLALLVTVSVFAAILYSQVLARTERDARAFLAVQVEEVVQLVTQHGMDAPAVIAAVENTVQVAEPDYKLGLQVYDQLGRPRISAGYLDRFGIGPPKEPPLVEPDDAVAEQPDLFYSVEVGETYPYLVLNLPVEGGSVQGGLYTRRFVRNARDLRNLTLYSAPVMLLLIAATAYGLARSSLRPIQEINAAAKRISATRLEETIPTTGSGDELDVLAGTLNDMMGRIRTGMARTRRFAANAAHELRTPLSRMRQRVEVTLEKDDRPAEEYRRALVEMAAEISSLSEAVHGLMRLARSEAGLSPEQRVEVDLRSLLSDVGDFFTPLAEEQGVSLHVKLPARLEVPGDPSWLHQVFANLVHNAIKYTPAGGHVTVSAGEEDAWAVVAVEDTGVGIDPAEADRVFEPFHRLGATPDVPGVGLGLPLARELTRAHGGDIALHSSPGRGTAFTVRLPVGRGADLGA